MFEKKEIIDTNQNITNIDTTTDYKMKILEDENKIIEETTLKFQEENKNLTSKINDLNNEIINYDKKILQKEKIINQFNIDKEELNFLRLNLQYGHKCRKSFLNNKGYRIGTPEYKNCVLTKGNN